jgi:hypothetical protein
MRREALEALEERGKDAVRRRLTSKTAKDRLLDKTVTLSIERAGI